MKDIKQKVRDKMNFYTSDEAAQNNSQEMTPVNLNTIHEVVAA